MNRRRMITIILAAAGAAGLGSTLLHAQQAGMTMAATPQKAPTKPIDPEPQVNDIEKYPRCAYCGMDRKKFHYSRMLIPYADGTVDGLCSIRCAVNSLTNNIGKGALAVWVGDNASAADTKPLTDAQAASYLVGSSLPGVMTKRSKMAYSTAAAADASKAANGGEVMTFDQTLVAAYTDVAESMAANLKKRHETVKGAMGAAGL
jgi:copper chaperone NosL